jgi:hypothetical protein
LQNNTIYENRTRNRQNVKRYTFDNSDPDITDDEEDIKRYNTCSRAMEPSDHNMRLRSSQTMLIDDNDNNNNDDHNMLAPPDSESGKESVSSGDSTPISQHKRKRRLTQSSIESSSDAWYMDNDATLPTTYDHRDIKYIKQHTGVIVQVPSASSKSVSITASTARQQNTLDAWTRSLGSKSSSSLS